MHLALARRVLFILLSLFALAACSTTPPPAPPPRSVVVESLVQKSVTLAVGEFGTCSGTWVGPDLILTAAHCTEEKIRYSVERDGQNNPTTRATEVVKVDEDADLALLRAEDPPPHLTASFGSAPQRGDEVCAVGAPFGMEFSFACGVVAHPHRERYELGHLVAFYIQATTPTSPGSSGGGLFNADGDLVGVTHATIGSRRPPGPQNLNLFIHTDNVMAFLFPRPSPSGPQSAPTAP